MEQFCKDVIDFLKSQYDDTFCFDIEVSHIGGSRNIELRITTDNNYIKRISGKAMHHIYWLYKTGCYYALRQEFAWKKELIDIIEGS